MTVTLGGVAFVGQITLERDGTQFGVAQQTAGFSEWVESGRDSRAYPGTRHEHVEHKLRLVVKDGTPALPTLVESIERAARPGALMTVDYDGSLRWTKVVDADFSQVFVAFSHAVIDLSVRCLPYWHAVEKSYTPSAISLSTCLFNAVPIVEGSVPALTRIGVSNAAATSRMVVGIRPDQPYGYNPIQDYQGTATEYTLNAQAAQIFVAQPEQFGTAAGANTYGLYDLGPSVLPVVRVAAGLADVRLRGRSTVQGANHTDIGTYEGAKLIRPETGTHTSVLGAVPVPAAAALATTGQGGEFGAEAVRVTQTSSTAFVDKGTFGYYSLVFTPSVAFRFTKASPYGRVTNFTSTCTLEFFLHEVNTGRLGELVDSGTMSITQNTAGEYFLMEGWLNPVLKAGQQYALLVDWLPDGNCLWEQAYTTTTGSTYIYGSPTRNVGDNCTNYLRSGQPRFVIYGELPLEATTSVEIQATYPATGGVDAWLDTVALVPTAWGAVVMERTSAANGGALIDFLSTDRAAWDVYRYINDGTNPVGIGHSVLPEVRFYGPPPLLQPGYNAIVVACAVWNVTPTTDTRLLLRWVERYLNPWGDE